MMKLSSNKVAMTCEDVWSCVDGSHGAKVVGTLLHNRPSPSAFGVARASGHLRSSRLLPLNPS